VKILIADDSAVARLLLQRALAQLGHEFAVAEDGARAWEMFQDSGADVVISDWMMPGMNGDDLCRNIRGTPRGSGTYVVLLTALEDKAHILEGMEAGADDYLTKPFDLDDLQARLIAAARVTALHARLATQQHELERLNEQLFRQSRLDALTGVGNRLAQGEELARLSARATRYGHTFSVALFDVDHFKGYNDGYGHLAGDEALKAVAGALADACRSGDVLFRYGGEELLVVLPEQDLAGAALAGERLRAAVEALALPHPREDQDHVTVSVGIAQCMAADQHDCDLLLKRADAALYRAKRLGRNRVELAADVEACTTQPDVATPGFLG
jgi:two-component system chemotaxis response regulator CheY